MEDLSERASSVVYSFRNYNAKEYKIAAQRMVRSSGVPSTTQAVWV